MAPKPIKDLTVVAGDRVVEQLDRGLGRSYRQLGDAFLVDRVYGNGNVTLRDKEGNLLRRNGQAQQFRAHKDGSVTQVGGGIYSRRFVRETPEVTEKAAIDHTRRTRYVELQDAYAKIGRQLQLLNDDMLDDDRVGVAARNVTANLAEIDNVIAGRVRSD